MREIELDENEVIVFDLYFAGVVSMAHCHPGSGRSNGFGVAPPRKSLEECADLTLQMIELRRRVMVPTLIRGYEDLKSRPPG